MGQDLQYLVTVSGRTILKLTDMRMSVFMFTKLTDDMKRCQLSRSCVASVRYCDNGAAIPLPRSRDPGPILAHAWQTHASTYLIRNVVLHSCATRGSCCSTPLAASVVTS